VVSYKNLHTFTNYNVNTFRLSKKNLKTTS